MQKKKKKIPNKKGEKREYYNGKEEGGEVGGRHKGGPTRGEERLDEAEQGQREAVVAARGRGSETTPIKCRQ